MSVFTVLATSKVAAGVLAAGTLAVGGTGAAAISGVLPTQAQQTAHEVFGAPAPKLGADAAANGQATPAPTATAAVSDALKTADASADAGAKATGTAAAGDEKVSATTTASADAKTAVDAAGPAALGLCTAFANGGLNASSTAFSSLSIAAKGDANIKSYCADVVAKADVAAKAAAAAKGSASVEAEKPAVPSVPAVPAVPGAEGNTTVPAVPAVPAVGGNTAHAPSVSVR
ncbi:hypothetical protein [Arthrobacter sp. 135MFCol5.1]|uniref:hypothetical protein n=1 Tax=Arthrobacter sp. 135MFCol5.1 TaxID=1158050 RepID=UPI00035EF774|nr:hypothetical protein [Arthrobacter sp. 135MFCol5.1]